MDDLKIQNMAKTIRPQILEISHTCNATVHLGGGLSMVEILATLYGGALNYDPRNPEWEGRDRFILSKGHGAVGLYSALRAAEVISEETFLSFMKNDSDLIAHPVMNLALGIESSNGSLGQGLAFGVGLAIAAKKLNKKHKIYVMLGNGECNEGSVWEAVESAVQFKLDNLVAIVDDNRLQSDGPSDAIMKYGDLCEVWSAFGWNTRGVDGHDLGALKDVFTAHHVEHRPKAIIARTVKGKGISFMENNNEWHHNRLTKAFCDKALLEVVGQ